MEESTTKNIDWKNLDQKWISETTSNLLLKDDSDLPRVYKRLFFELNQVLFH